ncbi:hypothetical protein STCU_10947 [Strigomonas culicis]|uniref:Uncharacterized protein n=1 Tax=Strigomonas culicis TaxID=28005 RepID=S9TKI7_9TRYP|nr:hypothetical protein STCU_10947 [Strigomonas culicis]|eukprot:EPY16853.1 hypothetical protein STCU_10947 [Strigomonas culicis]
MHHAPVFAPRRAAQLRQKDAADLLREAGVRRGEHKKVVEVEGHEGREAPLQPLVAAAAAAAHRVRAAARRHGVRAGLVATAERQGRLQQRRPVAVPAAVEVVHGRAQRRHGALEMAPAGGHFERAAAAVVVARDAAGVAVVRRQRGRRAAQLAGHLPQRAGRGPADGRVHRHAERAVALLTKDARDGVLQRIVAAVARPVLHVHRRRAEGHERGRERRRRRQAHVRVAERRMRRKGGRLQRVARGDDGAAVGPLRGGGDGDAIRRRGIPRLRGGCAVAGEEGQRRGAGVVRGGEHRGHELVAGETRVVRRAGVRGGRAAARGVERRGRRRGRAAELVQQCRRQECLVHAQIEVREADLRLRVQHKGIRAEGLEVEVVVLRDGMQLLPALDVNKVLLHRQLRRALKKRRKLQRAVLVEEEQVAYVVEKEEGADRVGCHTREGGREQHIARQVALRRGDNPHRRIVHRWVGIGARNDIVYMHVDIAHDGQKAQRHDHKQQREEAEHRVI